MKKKLLKVPQGHEEVLFIAPSREIKKEDTVLTAHQLGFFNPGVALKFLNLQNLPGNKKIIFIDTDKINLSLSLEAGTKHLFVPFFQKPLLYDSLSPGKKQWLSFFRDLKSQIEKISGSGEILKNISVFEKIVLNSQKKELKEVLAESFLDYYQLKNEYSYLSDELKSLEYKRFFKDIYTNCFCFRKIFNQVLDEYKSNFKFRFKNFPFPKLEKDELPFWIIKDKKRARLFLGDLSSDEPHNELIFPRASVLMIFLRLFCSSCFIHGVGGKNYEWVNDRIIERFFKRKPPDYFTVSGTFLAEGIKGRNLPFFFFSPSYLKEKSKKSLFSFKQAMPEARKQEAFDI